MKLTLFFCFRPTQAMDWPSIVEVESRVFTNKPVLKLLKGA
ncbi:MAG: hypothetical protein PHV03_01450 [Desulfitobacteriaceae bacterium]|nr:hypothetical protein [Desulfitobacteriaceae bacterium]